jgi:phosphohistidine phosphatase
MTHMLILMRHAKSDWGSPALPDHDRPLNTRGTQDAPRLGAWLRSEGFMPDQILCSTAIRTRQTLEGLNLDAPTAFLPGLYHADPDSMLAALHEATGHTVLLIGHNPGIATFAADLLQKAPDHPRFNDYPTCATLVARFDIDTWDQLEWGTGRAMAFAIPADL